MIFTPTELAQQLGAHVRARRIALNITQAEAAKRSGVSYATWRRLEASGSASIEDLARAAILLRCEDDLQNLFPMPPAFSMDELIKSQAVKPVRKRARVVRS
jgi:transcriptional regulator with XRE-family HTH domain